MCDSELSSQWPRTCWEEDQKRRPCFGEIFQLIAAAAVAITTISEEWWRSGCATFCCCYCCCPKQYQNRNRQRHLFLLLLLGKQSLPPFNFRKAGKWIAVAAALTAKTAAFSINFDRKWERESFEVTKNKTSRRGRNSVTARGPIDCCWCCRRSGQFANYQKILRRTGQEETSSNRLLAPSDAGVNECKHWFTVTQSAGTANWIS